MKHEEALRWLPEYAAGNLEAADIVMNHLDSCTECQDWLETYRVLESLGGPAAASSGSSAVKEPVATHPESELLAEYAVDPLALDPDAVAEIDSHLESCSVCHSDVQMTRAAVINARSGAIESAEDSAASKRRVRPAVRWALAAGLTGALVAAALFYSDAPSSETQVAVDPSPQKIEGPWLIEGKGNETVNAGELSLARGSNVTMRADTVVALGNGFSVERDADLRIELTKGSIVQ